MKRDSHTRTRKENDAEIENRIKVFSSSGMKTERMRGTKNMKQKMRRPKQQTSNHFQQEKPKNVTTPNVI